MDGGEVVVGAAVDSARLARTAVPSVPSVGPVQPYLGDGSVIGQQFPQLVLVVPYVIGRTVTGLVAVPGGQVNAELEPVLLAGPGKFADNVAAAVPVEKFFMDYFNKDNSNSIFYGTPKQSKIEIVSPNIIKYEKMVTGKKQFIILGKEKIKFNENFKIQFNINKFENHFYVGFINLDLALKSNSVYKFHNWKSEASILFSTRKTIWNYLDKFIIKKGGIKIKCNDIKTTSPITFIYNLKEKNLKLELRDFQTKIKLNSIVNTKNDFRFIIFFEGPGTIIQIKKLI